MRILKVCKKKVRKNRKETRVFFSRGSARHSLIPSPKESTVKKAQRKLKDIFYEKRFSMDSLFALEFHYGRKKRRERVKERGRMWERTIRGEIKTVAANCEFSVFVCPNDDGMKLIMTSSYLWL